MTADWRDHGQRDTAQMKWILWHAWHSICKLEASVIKVVAGSENSEDGTTRKSRKNAKQRQTVGAHDCKALRKHKNLIAAGKCRP